jgi:hypothetical protein
VKDYDADYDMLVLFSLYGTLLSFVGFFWDTDEVKCFMM